jgi:adenylate cyclase
MNQQNYMQLVAALNNISNMLGADRSSLFLIDKSKNQIYALIAQGLENTELRLEIGEGIAGMCAKTGQTINESYAQQSSMLQKGVDKYTGYVTYNALCVPVKSIRGGHVIGVIEVINKKTGPFDQRDECILNSFSTVIAMTIENTV